MNYATTPLGLKIRIDSEREIDLLGKNQDKIEISYEPPAGATTGNIKLPLGDKLPFKEGQQVTITMPFQPPNSKEIYALKYVFEGTVKKRKYTTMDALGSV